MHPSAPALFSCPTCHEPVPEPNRTVHALSCERHHRELLPTATPPSTPPTSPTEPSHPSPPTHICPFCELELPSDERAAHETFCGSRTDVCPNCARRVRKRDFAIHEQSGCALGATTYAASSRISRERAPLLRQREGRRDEWVGTAVVAAAATVAVAAFAAGVFSRRRRF